MYTQIDAVNVTGVDDILIYLANAVPIFIPTLLIGLYLLISLLIYYGTRKYSGQGDVFAAFAASGFFVAVIGGIMSFAFGVINTSSLVISILLAIVSFILLMSKRNRD